MPGSQSLSKPQRFFYDPANANLTGFASNVTGATWALTATSPGDGLAHQVSIRNDSANDKAAINITLVGTDQNGVAQTETIAGPGVSATVESTLYYLTLTSVQPASTWGADTADIGWVDEFLSPTVVVNYLAEDVIMLNVDVTGTINFTLQQTFDPIDNATITPRWKDVAAAGAVDGIWQTTGGATAWRMMVNSYTDTAEILLNANPTYIANAPSGGGSVDQDVNVAQVGGNALAADDAAAGTTVPLPVGGVYNSVLPAYTVGDRAQMQFDANGNLRTIIGAQISSGADGVLNSVLTSVQQNSSTSAIFRPLAVAPVVFNGASWDRMRSNAAASGGALLTELGPYTRGRVIADGQIKAGAGFIHTISIAGLTATPTAGLLTVYDSLTETGTVIYAEWVFATVAGHTVTLDVPCSTGIFVGFDATLTNVQCTIAYR